MSERINVDQAFDPEARKAQAELDAYMDSRAFKDEKGRAHAATGGKFINHEKHHDALRDDHYNESLEQGDYSNESLEQLAQRVATARAEGDKTRAADAEEVFFNKFAEYSDKYGWENEDDSANGPHVDKDAKLGRSTIDDRLSRYSKIMYGEDSEVAASAPVVETEEAVASEVPTSEPQNDSYVPKRRGEYKDETATPIYDEVMAKHRANVAEESAASEEEPAAFDVDRETEDAKQRLHDAAQKREQEAVDAINGTDQAREDRELLNPVSTEGLRKIGEEANEPPISLEGLHPIGSEEPALEGESLEEYETRNGVTPEAIAPVETAGLEPVSAEADPVQVRSRRLRDRFSPNALYHRAKAGVFTRKSRREEAAAESGEDNERSRKKKATVIGLGVLAAAAAGVGLYFAHKYGAADAVPMPKKPADADKLSGVAKKAHELFGNGSVEVHNGDGYTQVLDRVLDSHNIHLSSNELYELHQHLEHVQADYINLDGANDTYTMANGDSGLSRADSGAHVSEATQKAVVRWLQANGKM